MNETELETLLSQDHELEAPRPGLDTRIQARLSEQKKSAISWWGWRALAMSVLALGALFVFKDLSTRTVEAPERELALEQDMEEAGPLHLPVSNPLEKEALALQKTARRTASFLWAQLPSLPEEAS